jgi:hypothetical protein
VLLGERTGSASATRMRNEDVRAVGTNGNGNEMWASTKLADTGSVFARGGEGGQLGGAVGDGVCGDSQGEATGEGGGEGISAQQIEEMRGRRS